MHTVVQTIRTYAMFGRSKYVLGSLLALGLALSIICSVSSLLLISIGDADVGLYSGLHSEAYTMLNLLWSLYLRNPYVPSRSQTHSNSILVYTYTLLTSIFVEDVVSLFLETIGS